MLNYFRSLERTLTIYDGGLSLESTTSVIESTTTTTGANAATNAANANASTNAGQANATSGGGPSKLRRTTAQHHAKDTPLGRNLGNHAYMHNTPKHFRISQADFMQYGEIENHDDFYSVDETGFVHVQDHRGYFVVYDVALDDLK